MKLYNRWSISSSCFLLCFRASRPDPAGGKWREWDSITLLFTTNLDTLPGKLQLYYIWGASQVKCCILPHSLIQLPSFSSAHPLPAGSYNKHSSVQQRNLPSVLLSDWTPSVLVLAFCSLLNYTHSVSNTRITSGDTHIPWPGQTKPPESRVLLR